MNLELFAVLLIIAFSNIGISQDTNYMSLHPFVGDTIDQKENNFYDLFNRDFKNLFQSAQYFNVGNEVYVEISLKDKSTKILDYSIEMFTADMKHVAEIGEMVEVIQPTTNDNSEFESRLYLVDKKKKKRLRQGRRLWLKTYTNLDLEPQVKHQNYTRVKIIDQHIGDNTFLEVKIIRKWRPDPRITIPLNEIQSISYYSNDQLLVYKIVGIGLVPFGFVGLIPARLDPLEFIPFGPPTFVISELLAVNFILKKEITFDFDKGARFEFE